MICCLDLTGDFSDQDQKAIVKVLEVAVFGFSFGGEVLFLL